MLDTSAAYFDHNATTPLDPRVRDAMLPWLAGAHGNPSSAHSFGRAARVAVEQARAEVAAAIGAAAADLVFVSSGTEANNMIFLALADAAAPGHIVFSALEHASIRNSALRLEKQGWTTSEVKPNRQGQIETTAFVAALTPQTRLAALMLANNELGTIQPVAELATSCRARGIGLLCDAVQAIGKIPVDALALGVDFLIVGGHKFHGPGGVAALWIRPGTSIAPLLVGAGQERGLRSSTENVAGIVGLGAACSVAAVELAERHARLLELRRTFEQGLERIPDALVHGDLVPRLPHTSHVAFLGLSGHELMLWLDQRGFAVSTGAACHSGRPQASRAFLAMGLDEAEALASLRISFGLTNTVAEVQSFLHALEEGVAELRAARPR